MKRTSFTVPPSPSFPALQLPPFLSPHSPCNLLSCPWLHENRFSSALSSCEKCRALAIASALSSCENWRRQCDKFQVIDSILEAADCGITLAESHSASGTVEAGSTLRRMTVSSSSRSSVTSTNSSAPLVEFPGNDPELRILPPGMVFDAHQRSCLLNPLI